MSADRRFLIWSAAFVALCLALYALSGILLPFVAGIAIAYVLQPLAGKLERRGVPRALAAGLLVVVFFLVALLLVLMFVPLLQGEAVRFAEKLPGYVDAMRAWLEKLSTVIEARLSDEDVGKIREWLGAAASDAVSWLGQIAKGALTGGIALFSFLSLVVLTPLVTFYILRDWDRIVANIDVNLPRGSAPTIRAQVREIDRTLGAFARGQATVCIVLAAFYGIALTAIGLDFGILVGLIAGLLSFVPYLGFLVGFVLSVGLAAAQFGTWTMIGITAGIFLVGQFLEGNFLTPKIIGGRVGLHEVWIIFAILAGGALLDFLGVLLAVPVAATVGVLARFALAQYRTGPLYRSGPEPPPGGGA
jgi:predicted PurR-regulated permease PerM